MKLASRAERNGFDSSIRVAETRLTARRLRPRPLRDCGDDRAIRIGTGIVDVCTRGAALLAVLFVSLEGWLGPHGHGPWRRLAGRPGPAGGG